MEHIKIPVPDAWYKAQPRGRALMYFWSLIEISAFDGRFLYLCPNEATVQEAYSQMKRLLTKLQVSFEPEDESHTLTVALRTIQFLTPAQE